MNALVVVQRDDAESRIREDRLLDAAAAIVGRLDNLVREQVRARAPIEERWIRNISQYLGLYDAKRLADLNKAEQSTAFVKLTRHKTNGWSARISDLLFPTDNKNWGIQPTPIPKLTGKAKEAEAAAIEAVKAANAAADAGDPTAEQIAGRAGEFGEQVKAYYAAIETAKKRAVWMERTIEDQLVESDYITQCRDVIEDGCKLGTGILKGPTTVQQLRPAWTEVEGRWSLQQDDEPRPMFVRVDPWHFFPDMSARTIKDCEFTFERSLPTRKDLKRAARKLGFNKAAVKRLLDQGAPQFTSADGLSHIAELRSLTGESETITGRYIQWEYNGPLECEEIVQLLRASGRDREADYFEENKDPLDEHRVIIHFIGSEVLKIAPEYPLDSGDGLYSIWNFEKGEASIFGIGVPEMMSDSQTSINNAWRMMQDNSALSVGPQLIFNKGSIVPQDGVWGLRPMKIWLNTSASYAVGQPKPFDVIDVPNNQQELAGIIALAKEFADLESSMPDIAQGELGATPSQTASGQAMLMNSANVVFRRVVKSWDDDLTKPTLRRAYDWNMQFNKDESVKGDMQVDARGTSVLLVREIQSQNLMAIATNWTVHPVFGAYFKAREIAEKTLQTMMIPPEDVLLSQDEVDKKAAEAAQQGTQEDPMIAAKREIAMIGQQSAQYEADSRERIASMNAEVALMKASQESGLSVEELRTKFGIEEMKVQSAERRDAAKIAIEQTRQSQGLDVGQGVG